MSVGCEGQASSVVASWLSRKGCIEHARRTVQSMAEVGCIQLRLLVTLDGWSCRRTLRHFFLSKSTKTLGTAQDFKDEARTDQIQMHGCLFDQDTGKADRDRQERRERCPIILVITCYCARPRQRESRDTQVGAKGALLCCYLPCGCNLSFINARSSASVGVAPCRKTVLSSAAVLLKQHEFPDPTSS